MKLTQFSKAAGCGCKIAPAVLEEILKTGSKENFSQLLVGNESKDDAAVYDIGNEQCIISTTDFFMPIVDDAFDFGRVASANAISDVYAMGGKPLMAIAVLGWPVEKIPVEFARLVLEGSRQICKEAGIPLAGGHSVDSAEPIFGLAVTGIVQKQHLKKNNTVKKGDLLYLTKPLGTGILSTALKRDQLKEGDYSKLIEVMCSLNKAGELFGKLDYVHALTDVTGFGLAGHLLEMLDGNDLSAELQYASVPKIDGVEEYMKQFIFPDNTTRNYNAYKDKVSGMDGTEFLLLCDPQTSGGLLASVSAEKQSQFEKELKNANIEVSCIGKITEAAEKQISILH
ncbi:MAG: selenide, water dikinase SelD [Bacteroidia bacterium]